MHLSDALNVFKEKVILKAVQSI